MTITTPTYKLSSRLGQDIHKRNVSTETYSWELHKFCNRSAGVESAVTNFLKRRLYARSNGENKSIFLLKNNELITF